MYTVDHSLLYPVSLSAKRGTACTIVNDGPGSNPRPPVPCSEHSFGSNINLINGSEQNGGFSMI